MRDDPPHSQPSQRHEVESPRRPSRTARVANWLDQRTGTSALVRLVLDEPIPGGARWWYVFGSVLVMLLALQALTGFLLATAYSPSVAAAWASTAHIQEVLPLGWYVRGLHGFASSALIALTLIHLLQVLLFAAYRAPRELTWLAGLGLLGLLLAFDVTGDGLPWDERSYWAKQSELALIGGLPVVGRPLVRLIQGGAQMGNYTLLRLNALHTLLLPALTLLLLVIHVALVRRHGVTPKWKRPETELAQTTQPYWPFQAARDAVACGLTFVGLSLVVIASHGVPLGAPADPTRSLPVRPRWYWLGLHELRQSFAGPLEIVGAVVVPALLALLLASLPWLDRGASRSPANRKLVLAATAAGLIGLAVLTFLPLARDRADPTLRHAWNGASERARNAGELARQGVAPLGGTAVFHNDPTFAARELWSEHCASCHALDGGGGKEAPDFKGYNSRAWIQGFLRDPNGPLYMGPAKIEDGMKPVDATEDELRALTEMIYAETGADDVDRGLAETGRALFEEKDCDRCHALDGVSGNEGPNLKGRGTLAYLTDLIANPGAERFFGERNRMPSFARRLSPEEIAEVARLVRSQRAGH